MAILNLLYYPNPKLHKKAVPVTVFDQSLKTIIEDMAETMYENNGIGLAATQVDILKRIAVIDLQTNDVKKLEIFINPVITHKSGQIDSEEGCLSVPNVFESVTRFTDIKVEFQDLTGKIIKKDFSGKMAICLQHEIDHLDGRVFVDYLSSLKQKFIQKKLKKQYK